MRIEVYLDANKSPIQVLTPPEKFKFDTTKIADGKHELTFKAFDNNGDASVRVVPFQIQNGPAIAIHGISQNDRLSGEISILANAYGATIGDEFEPIRMETPAPIPTWAWVLFLSILAWGSGYISLEVHNRVNKQDVIATESPSNKKEKLPEEKLQKISEENDWATLGQQVYGNNCSSCHQANGKGLPGVFPALQGNTVVLNEDPIAHISAVLDGVSGKVIDGVAYASPMPGFKSQLNDKQIAAVVNHERSQWGNSAKTVTAEDVAKLRQ